MLVAPETERYRDLVRFQSFSSKESLAVVSHGHVVSNRKVSKMKTGYSYSGTGSLTGGFRLFCSALPVRSA